MENAQFVIQGVKMLITPEQSKQVKEILSLANKDQIMLGIEITNLFVENNKLKEASINLRTAQKAYMADRGNESLGKAVGERAKELDKVLGLE